MPGSRPVRPRLRALLLLPPLLLLRGGHAGNLTVAVVLPLNNTSYPWSWARVGPAVELALERVKARPDLLPGWTVRMVLGSSENTAGVCSDTAAPLAAVDLKWEHSPAVFLGPGCVYSAAPVGRFTAHWRVPLLTAGAPALGIGVKDEFALTTRTGPSHVKLGDFVTALHQQLGWEHQALVLYADHTDRLDDDRPCFFIVEGLYMRVRNRLNITVNHQEFVEDDPDHYTKLLGTVRSKGRGEAGTHRQLARAASSPASPQPGIPPLGASLPPLRALPNTTFLPRSFKFFLSAREVCIPTLSPSPPVSRDDLPAADFLDLSAEGPSATAPSASWLFSLLFSLYPTKISLLQFLLLLPHIS